nr:SH3 domain-containing protein [Sphingomonas jinjuensis]
MTGRSADLDPRTHAVRGDLADVRLAEYVFAPHYASPMMCIASRAASLHAERNGVEIVGQIVPGDRFEVLELAGGNAWGIAVGPGLVGYLDRTVLELEA